MTRETLTVSSEMLERSGWRDKFTGLRTQLQVQVNFINLLIFFFLSHKGGQRSKEKWNMTGYNDTPFKIPSGRRHFKNI